jgi:hypothetical protein
MSGRFHAPAAFSSGETEGGMGPKAGVLAVAKTQILSSYPESKPDTSAVQPLYRLSCSCFTAKRVKCVDTVDTVSVRVKAVSCNFLTEVIAVFVGNSFVFIGFR